MGTFATTTSFTTLLAGITLDSITTAQLTSAITWSEDEIRNCLSRRYDMSGSPFTTAASIPTLLTSLTERMTMGHYYKMASRGSKESITRGNMLLKDARETLQALKDRSQDLVDNSFDPINETITTVIGSSSAYHSTFDEDDPTNWTVDPDKIDDISSGRA